MCSEGADTNVNTLDVGSTRLSGWSRGLQVPSEGHRVDPSQLGAARALLGRRGSMAAFAGREGPDARLHGPAVTARL